MRVRVHVCVFVCVCIRIYPAGCIGKELVLKFSKVLLYKWLVTVRCWRDVRQEYLKANNFFFHLGISKSWILITVYFLGWFKGMLLH